MLVICGQSIPACCRQIARAPQLRLEWEAGFAIDYAIASVEQAKLAVLDAVDGRLAAEEAK